VLREKGACAPFVRARKAERCFCLSLTERKTKGKNPRAGVEKISRQADYS